MGYAKLTKSEEVQYRCHASEEDRAWLDRLQKVTFWKDARLMRDGSLVVRLPKERGHKFGCIAGCFDRDSSMAYVRQTVLKREKEIADEKRIWIENNPGWGI